MGSEERFWRSRLHWRLVGAMQWPVFVGATLLDGLILWQLPPSALEKPNPLFTTILATFVNLILLAVVAPFFAKRLAARRALSAPVALGDREVLQDRTAALLMGAGVVAALVSGLGNRPVVVSETRATEDVAREMRLYVNRSGSAELRRNLEQANTVKLGNDYFRVCVPRDDRRRYVCLFVNTAKDPTGVRRDPSSESNAQLVGPDEAGR